MTSHKELSTLVVERVAAEEGVEPTELSEPLYSVIDTESLENLFRADTGSVRFRYYGYEVSVSHSGIVSLEQVGTD